MGQKCRKRCRKPIKAPADSGACASDTRLPERVAGPLLRLWAFAAGSCQVPGGRPVRIFLFVSGNSRPPFSSALSRSSCTVNASSTKRAIVY